MRSEDWGTVLGYASIFAIVYEVILVPLGLFPINPFA